MILDQIKSVLESVDGVGVVHGYVRWAPDWEKFLALFSENGKVNGWMISRQSVTRHRTAYSEVQAAHIFVLTGIYGLNDADESELTFQGILDSVQSAFAADPTMGGACETINPEVGAMNGQYGLQIEMIENRMFGSVLCHTAECRLCCIELI
jgi:hypothetical protein